MSGVQTGTRRQAEHDAATSCVIAVACAAAFLVFVLWPVHADSLEVPASLEALWRIGFLLGAFLGPVAAGLAAWASGSALRRAGPDLTRRVRRLHWVTIAVATVLLLAYLANGSALRAWLD